MDFIVTNREQINLFCPHMPYVIISITDPDSEQIKLKINKHCIGEMHLVFHDIDVQHKDYTLFTRYEARSVLNFIDECEPQLVLISCEAGISRSAGVAAALSEIYNGHDGGFFKTHLPNRLVFRTILDEYYGKPDLNEMFK